MNTAQSGKTGVLKPRYHAENALLFAVFHFGLKPDHVAQSVFFVILPQLHNGIRFLSRGVRVGQAHGFHRAEKQRIAAAFGHHLNRQAAVEISAFFKIVKFRFFGRQQRIDKSIILRLGQRTVDVVKLIALVITRLIPGLGKVNTVFIDDRRNCIKKV